MAQQNLECQLKVGDIVELTETLNIYSPNSFYEVKTFKVGQIGLIINIKYVRNINQFDFIFYDVLIGEKRLALTDSVLKKIDY